MLSMSDDKKTISPRLSKPQVRKSMRYATIAAITGILGMSCIDGPMLTLVAIKLGGDEMFIGQVNFLIWGCTVFSIFSLSAMERFGKKKVLIAGHGLAAVFIAPLLLLPWVSVAWSAKASLGLLFAATLLRSASNAVGGVGWFPILQDIVPKRITGKFFARLRLSWQIAWLLSLFAIAGFLKLTDSRWWGFEIIFVIAILMYAFRVFAFKHMDELMVVAEPGSSPGIFERFKVTLANRGIRIFLVYILFYLCAHTMAQPFRIKMLNLFGYSDGFILAATGVGSLGAIVSLRFWGRLADKFGNRSVFTLSHAGMIVTNILWILVAPSAFGTCLVFVLFFLNWVFNSANSIAQTRYMMHTVPASKQYLMCIIHMVWGVSAATGPLIGGWFLSRTESLHFQSGAVSLNNYHILFIASGLLFIVPHLLRKKLRTTDEASTVQVLTIITRPVWDVIGPIVTFKANKKTSGKDNS
jgi:MFS family permease